jgi:predicted DNA-binding transcriptional regulator
MAQEFTQRNLHIFRLVESKTLSIAEIAREYSISATRVKQIYEKEMWRQGCKKREFYGLSIRAQNALSELGIKTKDELKKILKSDTGDHILLSSRRVGEKTLEEIYCFV